jgi:hypothetical protein
MTTHDRRPYDAHPLPGAAYVVLAAEMHWVAGMLYWAVLLRAPDGALVVAEQPVEFYSDAPARLHTADGCYRQAADRSPTTIGQVAAVRFVMEWSTHRSANPGPVAAMFTAASGGCA